LAKTLGKVSLKSQADKVVTCLHYEAGVYWALTTPLLKFQRLRNRLVVMVDQALGNQPFALYLFPRVVQSDRTAGDIFLLTARLAAMNDKLSKYSSLVTNGHWSSSSFGLLPHNNLLEEKHCPPI